MTLIGGTSLGAVLPTELINFKRRVSITQAPKLLINIKRRTSVQVYEDTLYGKRSIPVTEETMYGKRTCAEGCTSERTMDGEGDETGEGDVHGDLKRFFDHQQLSSEAPMAASMNGLHTSVQASRRGSANLAMAGSTDTAEYGQTADTVYTPMPTSGSNKLVIGTSARDLLTPSTQAVGGGEDGGGEDDSLKTTPSPTTTALQLDSPVDSPFHDSNGRLKGDFTEEQLSPKDGYFSVKGTQYSPPPLAMYSVHTPPPPSFLTGGQGQGQRGYQNGDGDGPSPPTRTYTPFSDKKMSMDQNRSISPDISRGGFFPELSPVCVSENISLVSPYRPAGYPTEPDSACSQSSSTTHTFSAHSTPELIPNYNSRDSFQGSNPRLSTRTLSPSQEVYGEPVKGENNKKLFDTAHMIGVQRAEVLETGRWSIKIPTINRWRHPSQTNGTGTAAATTATGAGAGAAVVHNKTVIGGVADTMTGADANDIKGNQPITVAQGDVKGGVKGVGEVEEGSGTEGSSGYMQYFFEEEHLSGRMGGSGAASMCASPVRSKTVTATAATAAVCVVKGEKEVEAVVGKKSVVASSSTLPSTVFTTTTSSSISSSAPSHTHSSLTTTTSSSTTITSTSTTEPTTYANIKLKSIRDVIPPFRLTGNESESELEESPDNSETKINTAMNRSIGVVTAVPPVEVEVEEQKNVPENVNIISILKKIEETVKITETNNEEKKINIVKNGDVNKHVNEKEIKQDKKVELKKTGITGLWNVSQKDGNAAQSVKTETNVIEITETAKTNVTENTETEESIGNFEARVVKKLDFNDDVVENVRDVQHIEYENENKGNTIINVGKLEKSEKNEKTIEKTIEKVEIVGKVEKKTGALNLWEAKKKAIKDEENRRQEREKEEKEEEEEKKKSKQPKALFMWEQKSSKMNTSNNSNNNLNTTNKLNSNIFKKNDVPKNVNAVPKTSSAVSRLAGMFGNDKNEGVTNSWLTKKIHTKNDVEKEVVSIQKREGSVWRSKINKSVSNSSTNSAHKLASNSKTLKINSIEKGGKGGEEMGSGENDDGEDNESECLDLWPEDVTEEGDRQRESYDDEDEYIELQPQDQGQVEVEDGDSVTVVMDKTWRQEHSMTGESSVNEESVSVLKSGQLHEDEEEVENEVENEVVHKGVLARVREVENKVVHRNEKKGKEVEGEVEKKGEDSFLNTSDGGSDALVSVSLHSINSNDEKGDGMSKGADKGTGKGKGTGIGKGEEKLTGKGKEGERSILKTLSAALMITPMKSKAVSVSTYYYSIHTLVLSLFYCPYLPIFFHVYLSHSHFFFCLTLSLPHTLSLYLFNYFFPSLLLYFAHYISIYSSLTHTLTLPFYRTLSLPLLLTFSTSFSCSSLLALLATFEHYFLFYLRTIYLCKSINLI